MLSTLAWLIMAPTSVRAQELKFESLKEQRIRVGDLPKAEESIIPSQLSNKAALPRLPKFETLNRAQKKVVPNVVEILAIQKPIGSLQRHGTLVRGHGVWVKHDGKVMLISAGHWLNEAVAIYLDLESKSESANPLSAKKESFEKRKYDRNPMKLIEKNPDRYLKLTTSFYDRNRNLAVLDAKKFPKKPEGLVLFDIENELASRIYGLSPFLGNVFVEALIFPPSEKDIYIGYYLQTNFAGILGAPLVSSEGKLVSISAYPHPTKTNLSLIIPPLALRVALDRAVGKKPKDDKKK